jgi:ABC-type antimicrobial peptide transport system permease subunit
MLEILKEARYGLRQLLKHPASMVMAVLSIAIFWPAGALGRELKLKRSSGDTALQIVGVASDAKYRTLGEEQRLYFYRPLQQAYANDSMAIHVRSDEPVGSVLPALRDLLRELDPTLPLVGGAPMEQLTAISLLPQRLASFLVGALGAVGLWLVAVGLYGLTSFTVTGQRREIGIRMVLGASTSQVLRRVLLKGASLAAIGIALGLLAAFAAGSLLSGFLYGLSSSDPLTFASAALIFLAVALVASFFPARRAARIDAAEALRYE